MPESLQSQLDKVRLSIKVLEAQRLTLGEEVIEPALAALEKQAAVLEEQLSIQAAPVEERRMVTILFIDMVGSTAMAESLDPEEWRSVVSKLHGDLSKAIIAHNGAVAQYLGDGLLAFFGSRQASEHDPENAIRAALDIQAFADSQVLSEKIQLRVGIHTGLVVVGDLGDAAHKEFTASGDAMNLAARLQSAAPPGGILISHDTYRYVRGVFDMTPQPPLSVKGKREPVQTYLVRRAKPRPFRSVARGVAGIETRTIGRDHEMQSLCQAYLRSYEGHGVVWVQLLGEPGIGKSRLLEDLTDWIDLREETTRLMRARAFSDDANQPFALVRRLWFDRFQIAEDIPLNQAETRWVERFSEFYGREDCEEAAHALGLLVGLPFENSPYIKAMRSDPTQIKGRAFVVSRELVNAVRKQSQVVILLEDLQWTDLASWDYLMDVFLDMSAGTQPNGLFIFGTARTEWHPPKVLIDLFSSSSSVADESGNPWGTLVELAPLTDEAVRQLAMELLQHVPAVPEGVIDLLVDRSEGVPYFAEEMVNWFIDHGILDTQGEQWRIFPEKLKEQPLPATLQHLLLTRLSSLSPSERAALQRGAIFGRRFWSGGVEALGNPAGAEVFGQLQPRGFIQAQPESAFQGDTEWSFHQNMLHEVTYESVLKRERFALHKVAAGWLEKQARNAGRLEEFAGLLGDHYQRAGELSTAVDWFMLAGGRALTQGAAREAVGYYSQALGLLPPVDKERRWLALLGREHAFNVLGEAEPRKADLGDILNLARAFDNDNYLAEANLLMAGFSTQQGDDRLTRQFAKEAYEASRRCGNQAVEAKALSLIAMAAEFKLESLQPVNQNIEEAMRLARSLDDKSVLAMVLFRAGVIYNALGDLVRCVAVQVEQVDLHHKLGDRALEAVGMGNLATTYSRLGLYKQARSILERARLINESLGAHRGIAYNLILLGELSWKSGDLRNAHRLLEQAQQEILPSQDTYGKVNIYFDLGMILLEMRDVSGALRRLNEAHKLAISFELLPQVCMTSSALASCAVMQGDMEAARLHIHKAWDHLQEFGLLGLDNPVYIYRLCAEAFDALVEEENLQQVLEMGHSLIMDTADRIDVPEWRQSFLHDEPDNRFFLELWERRKH